MFPILPPVVASPPPVPMAVQQSPAVPQTVPIDEILTIEANHWYEDLAEGKTYFEGGVKAIYGPTVLTSERLVVDKTNGVMVAEGESKITDPEATITAQNIRVEWRTGHGVAQDVRIEAGYVLIQGDSLETTNDPDPVWTVRGATVELTDLAQAGMRFWAGEIVVHPGKRAIAKDVYYQVFGGKIGPIPSQTFNLDKRVTGLKFPSLKYRSGQIGASWNSSILLNEQMSASASWNYFPKEPQEYQLQLTHSFGNPLDQKTRVAPRSDLDERARNGWFDNITVETPQDELDRVRDMKSTLSLGTFWNIETRGRNPDALEVSKAYDLVYEMGGPMGEGGWLATGRFQRIRPDSATPWRDRGVLDLSYLAPRIDFGNGWFTHARLDLIGTASEGGQFGIARSELGVFGPVADGLTVGGAYVLAGQTGTPDFAFDRLPFGNGLHLRADYQRGPYTLRFLTKYDFGTKQWYDNEWEFALAAGSLEPYISRRSFIGETRFGVRLRIDQVADRLLSRDQSRKNRPADSPDGR